MLWPLPRISNFYLFFIYVSYSLTIALKCCSLSLRNNSPYNFVPLTGFTTELSVSLNSVGESVSSFKSNAWRTFKGTKQSCYCNVLYWLSITIPMRMITSIPMRKKKRTFSECLSTCTGRLHVWDVLKSIILNESKTKNFVSNLPPFVLHCIGRHNSFNIALSHPITWMVEVDVPLLTKVSNVFLTLFTNISTSITDKYYNICHFSSTVNSCYLPKYPSVSSVCRWFESDSSICWSCAVRSTSYKIWSPPKPGSI